MDAKVGDEDIGPYGEPEKYDPEFHGPIEKRSCTDILCLIIFVAFLVGWGVVGVLAAVHGDPSRLLHPTDSRGQVCGRDELVKNKTFLYFFDLTKCATPQSVTHGCPTPQVCVEQCPDTNWFFNPLNGDSEKDNMICKYDTDLKNSDATDLVKSGECSSYYIESKSLGNRCIPTKLTKYVNEIFNTLIKVNQNTTDQPFKVVEGIKHVLKFVRFQQVAEGVFQDVKEVWYLILIGCFISMLISLLWIFLVRYISTVMVWFSLVAFTGLSGFGAYYTMNKYLTLRNSQETTVDELSLSEKEFTSNFSKYGELESTWLILFIITVVLFVVCLVIIIFLRKRVRIAIALIGQASKAVGSSMSTLFFPIFPFMLQLIFIAIFITITILITSAGEPQYTVMSPDNCTGYPGVKLDEPCDPVTFSSPCPTASCQFLTYYVTPYLPYLHIYNVFGILWILFFISAMGEMVLAGVFSAWYWTFDKSTVPSFILFRSLSRTFTFHVGTLAFGSLIIAIVRLIRIVLEYIDRKVKENTDNPIVKAVMCCCKCCLWCLEKFLKFINRNAYIYCAIYSKNFCSSAKNAFNLIMRNVLRVAVLDKVTDFLLFIGKLVITGSMGIASFYIFSREVPFLSDKLPAMNYYMTPVILITISTYFIASSFFSVYEMAVDTLFLCFLEDCERNDGSEEKPFYMSKKLMKILRKENEDSKLKEE